MSVDNSFRSVFDRTCQRLFQMVMATELPSNGNSDEKQLKSDAMADSIKGSPKTNTPSERQSSRALRSKSSRHNSNHVSKNNVEDQRRLIKDKEQPSRTVEDNERQDNHKNDMNSQVTQLRQLLILHLELIQQQQEKLQKRDRELNQLKIEKEQLESRIQRMERRMAVKKRRGDLINNDFETPMDVSKPTAPKRRLSAEQLIRSKRVPATASVVISSNTNDDVSFDSNMRTELLYLHPKTQPSTSDVLQDKQHCIVNELKPDENKNEEIEENKNITVPCWKVSDVVPVTTKGGRSTLTSKAAASTDPPENIDDEAFGKRHCKQEAEEKRRKRWDVQRLRAMQLHKNLEEKNRQREESRLKGRKYRGKESSSDIDTSFQSFLPSKDDIMAIEVSETVPVTVFGYPVPLFQVKEFEVPWFSLDRRELQERATKIPGRGGPGRGRGRGRGRRRGRGRGRGRGQGRGHLL